MAGEGVLALCSSLWLGCATDAHNPSLAGGGGGPGGSGSGTAPDAGSGSSTESGGLVVFLNRSGGTYVPGWDDSSSDTSSILSAAATIDPWTTSASTWAAVHSCMKSMWAPFGVTITDIDPLEAAHIEAVFAGQPSDIGRPSDVGGLAPFSCGVINRAVTFTFVELLDGAQSICEVASMEVAHAMGLEHVLDCRDPMSSFSGCGRKTFQDRDLLCGTETEELCSCGGTTQNSYRQLLAANGSSVQ